MKKIILTCFTIFYICSLSLSPETSSASENIDFLKTDTTKIIGTDDRVKIEDTTQKPYSSISYVQIYLDHRAISKGTAFVINENTLLTAAHVAENFIDNHEDKYRSFVAPGRDGKNYHFGKFYIDSVTIHPKYFSSGKSNKHDLALIKTKPNEDGLHIGATVPILPISNDLEMSVTSFISGYGGDKPKEQWFHQGNIISQSDLEIFYDTDVVGGNSGSPIFNERNNIIGVHVSGQSKGGVGVRNIGTRIVGENYQFVKNNM